MEQSAWHWRKVWWQSVTPRDRCSRRLPYISCSACVLFVCCIHHRIICIASALRCRHVLKLAFARRWRFSLCLHHLPSDRLACVDRFRPIEFFAFLLPFPSKPSSVQHPSLASSVQFSPIYSSGIISVPCNVHYFTINSQPCLQALCRFSAPFNLIWLG